MKIKGEKYWEALATEIIHKFNKDEEILRSLLLKFNNAIGSS